VSLHTAANAVPPLDDELADRLEDLAGIHPGIDQIRDGIRLLALDRHTPGKTQTLIAALAGIDGVDLITVIGLLVQRLTDPVSNPALRTLTDDQQKNTQRQGQITAYVLNDPDIHQPASDACAAISDT
jgi:hypothetical protein